MLDVMRKLITIIMLYFTLNFNILFSFVREFTPNQINANITRELNTSKTLKIYD